MFLIYRRLGHRNQNLFLVLSSYFFYACWDWCFVFLLFALTIFNYFIGLGIWRSHSRRSKKTFLVLSLCANLGVLCFFKYFDFFVSSAISLVSVIGIHPNVALLRVVLPVGISFYTFQVMTYTIDIYRGKLRPTRTFLDVALFVSFFPQLLSGPIERAANLLPQISRVRTTTKTDFLAGLNLLLLGYFKKVAIADSLSPFCDKVFGAPADMTGGQLWSGVYAFAIQIYCDFSGYTDIARGVALILGFRIMENFETPYLSKSIAEFWRRWHISLSSWLRDYLYIPLGGNRKGNARTYLHLLVTFLLCGLWHGAAWTFVLWGFAHGIYVAGHRMILSRWKGARSGSQESGRKIAIMLKVFLTFHIVAITWVLFKSSNLSIAVDYFKGLLRLGDFSEFNIAVIFAGCLVLTLDMLHKWYGEQTWLSRAHGYRVLRLAAAQFIAIGVVAAAIGHLGTATPFIYFQF